MKVLHNYLGTNAKAAVSVLLTTASLALASAESADEFRAQTDGITFRVHAFRDAVVFCIGARRDLKISSQYGVQFQVDPSDTKLWNEVFPKTVTGPAWYFDLPLRVELRSRGDVRQRLVDVDLGACSDTTLCNPIRLRVTVPSYRAQSKAVEKCN